jgi:predicted  nucleic acid-binding Zn-ribbon protein
MADSMNIPLDLTNIIKVEQKTEPLRRFLADLLNRVQVLEKENTDLKNRIYALENP